jgi:hypothetical protein
MPFDAIGLTKRGSKKGEHRENATVVLVGLRQAELPQDAVHVIFDRSLGDPQVPSDTGVGATLRHQGEHLALARRELVERIVGPPGLDELLDESRIDD